MKVVKKFVGTQVQVTSGIVEVQLDDPQEGKLLEQHPENYPEYEIGSRAYCARTDGENGLDVWLRLNDGSWQQVAGEEL